MIGKLNRYEKKRDIYILPLKTRFTFSFSRIFSHFSSWHSCSLNDSFTYSHLHNHINKYMLFDCVVTIDHISIQIYVSFFINDTAFSCDLYMPKHDKLNSICCYTVGWRQNAEWSISYVKFNMDETKWFALKWLTNT